ncbi:MAG: hypothetical protein FJX18_05855 [Alphaproteobacteria bacterium]|nr:hypothetical protein [Alphaproteobacteria bacterium]
MANTRHIERLESQGKLFVTRQELTGDKALSSSSLRVMVHRLKKAGRLVSLGGGCYLIVPHLYKKAGAPPIEWYLDDYMKFLKINYYAGLLTAAAYHGASHQAPQVYQVIVDKKRKALKIGRSLILFIYKNPKSFKEQTSIQPLTSIDGTISISSPESTALDLLMYEKSATSLNNIATIIAELAPKLNQDTLKQLLEKIPPTYSQRLGYILEKTSQDQSITGPLLKTIKDSLKSKDVRYRLLHSATKRSKTDKKDFNWHLVINTSLEFDTI